MGTRKIDGPLTSGPTAGIGHNSTPTAKWHVEQAIKHITVAAELTQDPGLQGDLERSRAKLQRRIDLTQGL